MHTHSTPKYIQTAIKGSMAIMKLNKPTPFTRLGTAVYMNTAHLNPAEHAWEIVRLLLQTEGKQRK